MFKRLSAFALLLSICLAFPLATHAQDDSTAPIFFLMDGDIWSYRVGTGQLTQESTWGYNESPLLSPNGSQFVYTSLAQVGANFMDQQGYLFDPQPMNIWLWDIATNEAIRLVDQPAGAAISADGGFVNIVDRRSVGWSPDSTQLAWLNLSFDFGFSLSVYDLATQTERIISEDIPSPYGDAGMIGEHELHWGLGGIAVLTHNVGENFSGTGSPFQSLMTIYDPVTGAKIAENVVGNAERNVMEFVWLDSNRIYLSYYTGERAIYFVNTGGLVGAGQLELFSLNQPQNDISLFLEKYVQNGGQFSQSWSIFWPNGQPHFVSTFAGTGYAALSPSGDIIAYVADALYLWDDGTTTKVAGTESLADEYNNGVIWGPVAWRMIGDGTENFFGDCGGIVSRLSIGGRAIVIPGLGANVLRDLPGKNVDGSTEIGSIPPNATVTILAGPQCASNILWWQVDYNGQVGWTGEGENGVYWLEPR